MRDVNKDNITDVFMSYFGDDTEPRLREIMQSLASHLHNFARDVNLTHAEWLKGIQFLEAAGIFPTRRATNSFCCRMFSGCHRLLICCIRTRAVHHQVCWDHSILPGPLHCHLAGI